MREKVMGLRPGRQAFAPPWISRRPLTGPRDRAWNAIMLINLFRR